MTTEYIIHPPLNLYSTNVLHLMQIRRRIGWPVRRFGYAVVVHGIGRLQYRLLYHDGWLSLNQALMCHLHSRISKERGQHFCTYNANGSGWGLLYPKTASTSQALPECFVGRTTLIALSLRVGHHDDVLIRWCYYCFIARSQGQRKGFSCISQGDRAIVELCICSAFGCAQLGEDTVDWMKWFTHRNINGSPILCEFV